MKNLNVLNVAEKPSVAREITNLLAQSSQSRKHSHSKYNPVMSFRYNLKRQPCNMIFTSVSGHIMRMDFHDEYRDWNAVKPESLFTAPIKREIDPNLTALSKNLETYASSCQWLILWLDCDREGEGIAYEVIDICKNVNPSLDIYRAVFSSVTDSDIRNACENLQRPKKSLSEAVEARSELDLRIGASFTRFMSIRYQRKLELPTSLISFGPCQFPTLGFIVERFIEIEEFIPQKFWFIEVIIPRHENEVLNSVEFHWARERLFDRSVVFALFELCFQKPQAIVTKVTGKKKTKLKPVPLNTVEMNKAASTHLNTNSHKCMQIAESLYNRGIISYPRTETQGFGNNIDLLGLIKVQQENPHWGNYAKSLVEGKYKQPRSGSSNDQAHPPIHPVKSCRREDLNSDDEWKLYQFIAKHFLAVCSDDAYGFESSVQIDISGEQFYSNGLTILETNWLDIYTYEKWLTKKLPKFSVHEHLEPSSLLMKEGKTTPPNLLKESDLLEKMNQHGIGTDATMHEHIHTIEERKYTEKTANNYFTPTKLGAALIKGYKALASPSLLDLTKPALRASMESDMTCIAGGMKLKKEVIDSHLMNISNIFSSLRQNISKLDNELLKFFKPMGYSLINEGHIIQRNLSKCGNCGSMMDILVSKPNIRNTTNHSDIQASRQSSRKNSELVTNKSKEIRILVCKKYHETCKTILQLPNNGDLSANSVFCHYCNFQALNVYNPHNKKTHNICPNCFTNPPTTEKEKYAAQDAINIEDGSGFRCFMCHNQLCPLMKEKVR